MKIGEIAIVALAVAACGHGNPAPAGNAVNTVASTAPAPAPAPAPALRFVGCSAAVESAGFRAPAAFDVDATQPHSFAWSEPGGDSIYGNLLGSDHPKGQPTVQLGQQPPATGNLDKAIIRRVVKRNIQKIKYCYEKQLLKKPGLEGTVMVRFFIAPSGKVTTANGTGVDPVVASCVADVIHAITFPKPKGGGGIQVNYPFTFRSADDATGSAPLASGSAASPASRPAPPKPEAGPWTPFAPLLATAPPDVVAATSKEFAPRLASIEACLPPGRTGALRAMFRVYSDGGVTTRVGGIGDGAIESCVTRALAGFAVTAPPSQPVEVACDVVRGDDPSWRVTPGAPYTTVEITATDVRMGSDHWSFDELLAGSAATSGDDESGGTGTAMALDEGKMGRKDSDAERARQQAIDQARSAGILGASALGPSFSLDDDRGMFLAIVDPDAPLANLAYVLDRMSNAGVPVLVAVREPTGAPRFAFAGDYRSDFHGAAHGQDLALRLAAHHLDVCSPTVAVPSATSSDPAAVDAALGAGLATCADKKCAAADLLAAPDATAAELLAVTARIRHAGIDVIRFVPQRATCVQPGAGTGGGSASSR